MKQEIQDISDKDAGIVFCNRCSKDTKSFYRWWQRKNRGYFIKVCGECHYSPYQECKEAEPMEENKMEKDRNYLIEKYNATSTDDGTGEIETYEAWLEKQLLNRIKLLDEINSEKIIKKSQV